jgi:hypothetical protein
VFRAVAKDRAIRKLREDYRLPFTPIFVENFRAVFCGDSCHEMFSFDSAEFRWSKTRRKGTVKRKEAGLYAQVEA